jgi:four helix bundle protein
MSNFSDATNRHLPIEEMELYRLFDEISDWCWDAVESWPTFAKRTMAEQLVTAADSVCANLVEGDGRWGVKDGINFFIMARASARETRMWLRKAIKRKKLTSEAGEEQIEKLTKATRLLNLLIKYRRERGSFTAVREITASYDADPFTED